MRRNTVRPIAFPVVGPIIPLIFLLAQAEGASVQGREEACRGRKEEGSMTGPAATVGRLKDMVPR